MRLIYVFLLHVHILNHGLCLTTDATPLNVGGVISDFTTYTYTRSNRHMFLFI